MIQDPQQTPSDQCGSDSSSLREDVRELVLLLALRVGWGDRIVSVAARIGRKCGLVFRTPAYIALLFVSLLFAHLFLSQVLYPSVLRSLANAPSLAILWLATTLLLVFVLQPLPYRPRLMTALAAAAVCFVFLAGSAFAILRYGGDFMERQLDGDLSNAPTQTLDDKTEILIVTPSPTAMSPQTGSPTISPAPSRFAAPTGTPNPTPPPILLSRTDISEIYRQGTCLLVTVHPEPLELEQALLVIISLEDQRLSIFGHVLSGRDQSKFRDELCSGALDSPTGRLVVRVILFTAGAQEVEIIEKVELFDPRGPTPEHTATPEPTPTTAPTAQPTSTPTPTAQPMSTPTPPAQPMSTPTPPAQATSTATPSL